MPVYDYLCLECCERFEITKSIAHCDDQVLCEKCHGQLRRVPSIFSFKEGNRPTRVRDGFQGGFNPAIGEYVRTMSHQKELMRRKGLREMDPDARAPQMERTKKEFFSEGEMREIVGSLGADLSGREAEKLKRDGNLDS